MPLPRNCSECNKRFQPIPGVLRYLCGNCRQRVRHVNFIKMMNVRLGNGGNHARKEKTKKKKKNKLLSNYVVLILGLITFLGGVYNHDDYFTIIGGITYFVWLSLNDLSSSVNKEKLE